MSRPRVLLAPRNIAGQPSEWARALRALGVEAEVWSFGAPAFGIPVDRVLDQDRLLAEPDYRWRVLADAVERFDVFHFQYGRSLLNPHEPDLPQLWDLPLLKSLGRKVFMHWHGSDVRLRSVHMEREGDSSYLRDATVDEEAILGRVAICRRYCDRMFVSTPGLLDYVPDAVLVPLAIDTADPALRGSQSDGPPAPGLSAGTDGSSEPGPGRVPVVAHAPSRRSTKGSDLVDAALTPLAEAGVIVYRALSGLTREQVRAEFARADMVVDSLTIGDHGMVAVEAMAAGRVALAHVHPRNRDRVRTAAGEETPVVEVTPDTLADVVRTLAADPAERARIGARGRAWVAAHHDARVVAALLRQEYTAPPVKVVAGYPDWPKPKTGARVTALEQEVERLRTLVDPLRDPAAARAAARPPLTPRDRLELRPRLHLAVRRWSGALRRLR